MIPDELEVLSEASPAEVAFLEERLYEFNVEKTGLRDGEGLAIFVRDPAGTIRAGLAGHTWGGCCEIRQVWIHESLRGRGLGRRLLAAAEAEARRRHCTQIVLSTHSFQAPGLYRKLGFTQVAALQDYPRGHAQLFFRKRLGGEKAPGGGGPAW